MRTYRILYPDKGFVTAQQISMWASDAYFDHADWLRCCACGENTLSETDCPHDADCEPIYKDGFERPLTTEEQIDFLQDVGEVTFGSRRQYDRSKL